MEMKRWFFIFLVFILISAIFLSGCSSETPSSPPPPQEGEDPAPQPTGGPYYGGTLRGIRNVFPNVLGYPPDMSSTDSMFAMPYAEMLIVFGEGNVLTPILAESWDEDPENKHITFNLRKGIRFHDGTPFNADAVHWNFQIRLDNGSLAGGGLVDTMEVIDEYTFRIHAKEYHSMLALDWGWVSMYSPTAFEVAGDGDLEKSIEWARRNPVGTGPFKLANFERDSIIRYERNEDYWREGYPYLDAIEIRYVPNSTTAAAIMEAGEADIWFTPTIEELVHLVGQGFKENVGFGAHIALQPDSADPNSPFADKRVREAVEYAIDRTALALMIGHGYYEPLMQMGSVNAVGYTPGYAPRPFNPDKARELLEDAGYPDGFETTILASDSPTARDALTAIQSYLDAVGIKVRLDIADNARYVSGVFREGFSGLAYAVSGLHPIGTGLLVHYGPNPMTFRAEAFLKSPEYLEACQRALQSYELEEFNEAIRLAHMQASEDVMVIPLFSTPNLTVMQPYVYSDYILVHPAVWDSYNDWLDKP